MTPKEFIEFAVTSDQEECLIWPFSKDRKGYGQIMLSRQNLKRAHRLVCSRVKGEPGGPHVLCLHSCANPSCVNPKHLSFGSAADNSAEMVEHGNSTRGVKNPRAVLTVSQVREIRKLLDEGHTQSAIADMFGVSRGAVLSIHLKKNWGWLD